MLLFIILILFITFIILFFIPKENYTFIKLISLISSGSIFFLSALILISFNNNNYYFQNIVYYNIGLKYLNISYSFGLDGISLLFFFLSSLLIFFCILFIWEDKLIKQYVLLLLLLEVLLLLVFSVLDLFLFYVFFEGILIPMYFLIGILGSRERKIRAAYLFFFILYLVLCVYYLL